MGACASSERLRAALVADDTGSARPGKARVLHLLAHGVLDADPTQSRIQLSDAPLTLRDIWGLNLEGVELAALTSCNTGIGEWLAGDEIVSLQEAFTFAGSASVLAALWYAYTPASVYLMNRFHEELEAGRTKAQALKAAQRATRSQPGWEHPYYWAAFTLRGVWL